MSEDRAMSPDPQFDLVLAVIREHDAAAGALPRWGERPVGEAANEAEHDRRWLLALIDAAPRAATPTLEEMRKAYERGANADDLVRLIDAALAAPRAATEPSYAQGWFDAIADARRQWEDAVKSFTPLADWYSAAGVISRILTVEDAAPRAATEPPLDLEIAARSLVDRMRLLDPPTPKGPVVGWRYAAALRALHDAGLTWEEQPDGVRKAIADAAAVERGSDA